MILNVKNAIWVRSQQKTEEIRLKIKKINWCWWTDKWLKKKNY